MEKLTDFGFEKVPESQKSRKVGAVFDSVAGRYDVMNDVMSFGLHRLWKKVALAASGVKAGSRVLDIATGTGDLALGFLQRVGETGIVVATDINAAMLTRGRDRLLDSGFITPTTQCDAERLPFRDHYFDCVCVAFGLRNMTHKDAALGEMFRVLRPGGRLLILEFSRVHTSLQKIYDAYSFHLLPRMGQWIAKDADSYRYLAESIRRHPSQDQLKEMMEAAGFESVDYQNLSGGVVALHKGFKF